MVETVAFKEFDIDILKRAEEELEELEKKGYSFKILGEGCDEAEPLMAYSWGYFSSLDAWRNMCGRDSRQNKRLVGWRFAVFVDYKGETVHSSGFVYKSFAEAAMAIIGKNPTIAWSLDLDGSEETAAPFVDPRIHRSAVREKPYQK